MLPRDLFVSPSVRCGDGTVMLDFETDTYFCRYDAQPSREADTSRIPAEPIWCEPPDVDARLAPSDVWLFLRAYAAALMTFPGRSVRRLLIEAVELERVRCVDAPSPVALAARFERLSLYLPFRPSCLLRASALLHYLALHGHDADWVIGVQLFPFRAHCWLARADMLLAERAHLIEDYVPIYRLRKG